MAGTGQAEVHVTVSPASLAVEPVAPSGVVTGPSPLINGWLLRMVAVAMVGMYVLGMGGFYLQWVLRADDAARTAFMADWGGIVLAFAGLVRWMGRSLGTA